MIDSLLALAMYLTPFAHSCSVLPPPNTNWLNAAIEFDEKTIPKGVTIKGIGNFYVEGKLVGAKSAEVLGIQRDKRPIAPPLNWIRFPFKEHIRSLSHVIIDPDSETGFGVSKPKTELPPKEEFKLEVRVDWKDHLVTGHVVYSKNPNYNPDAFKNWKNPCDGW